MLINVNLLKAVNCAVTTDETRFYLKGVFLQTTPSGIILVATDGHKMICARQKYIDGENAPDGVFREAPNLSIIIPTELIAKLKTTRKSIDYADLQFDNGKVTIAHDGVVFSQAVVDGTFPDFRRVVPLECDGKVAQFDPNILSAFSKALKIMGQSLSPIIHHNGNGPALVSLKSGDANYQWFGCVMPFRAHDEKPDVTWATSNHVNQAIAA